MGPTKSIFRAVALSRKMIAGEAEMQSAGLELAYIVYSLYQLVSEQRVLVFFKKQKDLCNLSDRLCDNGLCLQLEVDD